jgi:hypothetical protein
MSGLYNTASQQEYDCYIFRSAAHCKIFVYTIFRVIRQGNVSEQRQQGNEPRWPKHGYNKTVKE